MYGDCDIMSMHVGEVAGRSLLIILKNLIILRGNLKTYKYENITAIQFLFPSDCEPELRVNYYTYFILICFVQQFKREQQVGASGNIIHIWYIVSSWEWDKIIVSNVLFQVQKLWNNFLADSDNSILKFFHNKLY